MSKRILVGILIGILAVVVIPIVATQFIPYGHNHTNPPVQAEPKWDSPQTRGLAKRACFDCHSNETVWPWYSNIALVSWLIQQHVDEGCSRLNFSERNVSQREARRVSRVIQEGEMPLSSYLLPHPTKLSAQETRTLIQGLNAPLLQQ